MQVADLKYEWVPLGTPWWDPAKEMKGAESAIANGLDTPQRISQATLARDFYENIDDIADAMAYAAEKGVPLRFAMNETPAELDDLEPQVESDEQDDEEEEDDNTDTSAEQDDEQSEEQDSDA